MNDGEAHRVIACEPVMVVLTPYALGRSAHHLFTMARGYAEEGDAYLARQYLYCASVELGFKAAILADDCTQANKTLVRRIGHDLIALHKQFELVTGCDLLNQEDLTILRKITPYFEKKGLEYFTLPVMVSTIAGREDMPSLEEMDTVGSKVNALLVENTFFRDGKTTEQSSVGILSFI